ncbi:MAG: SMC-Scp complex subunit ScpB [Paenibacillaceae bacterium]|nr:SMC-Scp complex subunit ScpB [Paenibacillaceae bacterium]
MEAAKLKSIIEGLLLAAGDEGLTARQLAEVLDQDSKLVADLVNDLKRDLKRLKRGVQVVEIAGSYQLTTLPAHAPYLERLAYSPAKNTLSQAALETLAIIAYRQPLTRIAVEEIRGVKCDRAIHTLVAKDLIEEVGRADALGRPILYGTTKSFLDYFGLGGIGELPDSAAFENDIGLEEDTRMLFDKLGGQQLTIDDIAAMDEDESDDADAQSGALLWQDETTDEPLSRDRTESAAALQDEENDR